MSDYKKNPLKEWKKYVNKTKRETLTELYSAMPIGRDRGRRFDMSGAVKGIKTSSSGVDRAEAGAMDPDPEITKKKEKTKIIPDCPPGHVLVRGKCIPHPEAEGIEDPRLKGLCPPGTERQGTLANGMPDCQPVGGGRTCPDGSVAQPGQECPPSSDPDPTPVKPKYGPGAKGRDPAVGRELMKAMKDAAADEGLSSWSQLPINHPARANYRAWYKGKDLPHPDAAAADDGGGEPWTAILATDGETVIYYKESTGEGQCDCPDDISEEECAAIAEEAIAGGVGDEAPDASVCKELDDEEPDEEQVPEEPQCDDREVLLDALALYRAMKGMGTDEDAIYAVLRKYGTSCARELYEAYDQILQRADEDPDDGDLFDWLIDDGERTAARLLRRAIMMQSKSGVPEADAEGAGGRLTEPMQESTIRVRTRKSNKKRRR